MNISEIEWQLVYFMFCSSCLFWLIWTADMALYGEKECYFFTPRPNRAAGFEYWKATIADKPIGKQLLSLASPSGDEQLIFFFLHNFSNL
jgi:hypothetical protein